jgi:hypothetical protein
MDASGWRYIRMVVIPEEEVASDPGAMAIRSCTVVHPNYQPSVDEVGLASHRR